MAITVRYGCLFCKSEKEAGVVRALEKQVPGTEAVYLRQYKHRSRGGVKTSILAPVLPGYVFFRTEYPESAAPIHRLVDVIRLLRYADHSWELRNGDERFAQWVFEQEGILRMSQARKIGDRIVIAKGPLKDMEGSILKMDRHSRNGLVEIRLNDKVFHVWLPFEVLEEDAGMRMNP